jgi:AraC-like DNA-binding protein
VTFEHPPLRAGSLRGFNHLGRIGSSRAARWLRGLNVDTDKDRWEDGLVSYRSVIELVEGVSLLEDFPDLGLTLAEMQDVSVLGALGVAMQNGRNLRESLKLCESYIHFHSPACEVRVETAADGSAFVAFDIAMAKLPRANQTYEVSLGLGHRWAKSISGCTGNLFKEVWFKHLPAADMSAYRRVFGVTPKFGMPRAGLVISAQDLDRPNQSRNDVLSDISIHFLRSHSGLPAASTTSQVRWILSRKIGDQAVSPAEVASALCITVRTLQRRLQAENTSFHSILDDVRRRMTEDYLRQTRFSLAQVAERMQFSDASAFTRACHRWFGSAPKPVRQAFLAEDRLRRQEIEDSLRGALDDGRSPASRVPS